MDERVVGIAVDAIRERQAEGSVLVPGASGRHSQKT
jgi:hypothetical protein